MPDPSYVIETGGREAGLLFHLETAFYPPLPGFVKDGFVEVFTEYWNGEIPIENLDYALETRAWYCGGAGKYNFHLFLNEEDLNDD